MARRPKPAKLVTNPRLLHYVQDRLAGKIQAPNGREIAGPRQAPFKGRNKPHRGDRQWVNGWSPEQIANRLQVDFPEDASKHEHHRLMIEMLKGRDNWVLAQLCVDHLQPEQALLSRADPIVARPGQEERPGRSLRSLPVEPQQ